MTGRRVYFPDEEPETSWIEYGSTDGCEFCGQEGHTEKECPARPIPKFVGNTPQFGRRAS